jgi:hypothetical protein
MATHDYNIANADGATVRTDINNALAAIVSQNSSASAPTTTFAYQWWADTTTGLLKIRNAANSAWITVGTLASVNLGLLALSGGTMTGALELDAFEDVAAAATCNIGAATSNLVRITGGTTITSFGTAAAGVWRVVRVSAGFVLTYNSTSLILPSGQNVSTAADDGFLAISLGSGNWIVLLYQRASGQALSQTQLAQVVNSATHSLTNADNGKSVVFTQSCSCLISLPGSLSNGWAVKLYNLAGSASPLTLTGSFFVGSASQISVLGYPGINALDVTLINSLYHTSERGHFSGDQTYAAAGTLQLVHNLGAKPNKVMHEMLCIASNIGYLPGEIALINPAHDQSTANNQMSTRVNSAQIDIAFGSALFNLTNPLTGAAATITAANWRFRTWAFY